MLKIQRCNSKGKMLKLKLRFNTVKSEFIIKVIINATCHSEGISTVCQVS